MNKGSTIMTQPQLANRRDAAHALGLSIATIDRAIKRGDLKAKKYGTRVLVPQSEIERFASLLAAEDGRTQ
ncbi:MAG TPA: helix-turn-helix domain-containing protein [Stellaceae bacterium]|jgi:excisionase family DNA binding protein|nr:helix-turn-helix domain-containing protein [Stellaceae bacterium]